LQCKPSQIGRIEASVYKASCLLSPLFPNNTCNFPIRSEWYAGYASCSRHISGTSDWPLHRTLSLLIVSAYGPLYSDLYSSRLQQCRRNAYRQRQSNSQHARRLELDAPNIVRNNLELPVNDNHLCVDCCAPKCTTAKSVESALESVQNHVLDDNRARVGTCVGGPAILCCKGDT
jgi:hypothetical protein